MRIGELVNLEWDDIDFVRRTITIRPKDFWKPNGNEVQKAANRAGNS